MSDIKKAVLAYSGGLDTSVILNGCRTPINAKWSPSPPTSVRARSWNRRVQGVKMGIQPENIFIDDMREEFVRDFVFPMFRQHSVRRRILLGTSIARPLIAKR